MAANQQCGNWLHFQTQLQKQGWRQQELQRGPLFSIQK